jgi:predicted membrane protein
VQPFVLLQLSWPSPCTLQAMKYKSVCGHIYVKWSEECSTTKINNLLAKSINLLWNRVHFEKLTVTQLVMKILSFYFMEPKAYYHIHKRSLLQSILVWMNPVHTLTVVIRSNFTVTLPSIPKSSLWSLPLRLSD